MRRRSRIERALHLVTTMMLLFACGCVPPAPVPALEPTRTAAPVGDWRDNWPLEPATAWAWLRAGAIEAIADAGPGGGTTGARKVILRFRDSDRPVAIKWKPVPRGLDSWNNSPRKEVAAFQVQRLFLDPEDWVVPATVVRCLPLQGLPRTLVPRERALPGARCVLGVAALWLTDVRSPRRIYDDERFGRDPAYRRRFANLNLLTYLIAHRDGRRSNFLISANPARPAVYVVDNGIAFGAPIPNVFVPRWDGIKVDALPRPAIDRLRRITRAELDRLGVVAELRRGADRIFRSAPHGTNLAPAQGARRRADVVQLGLTVAEIDRLEDRMRRLLADVTAGRYPVF